MYRLSLKYLRQWFHRDDRKPLILRGARQVGKTTLVRLFADTEKLELIEVNMEDPQSFVALLKNNQPQEIFELLALERGLKTLLPEQTLIFFDEVQECPEIIPFLRYCHERAQSFRVICAGSLLEFSLGNVTTSFPVGRVEYMYLHPMSFDEYVFAVGGEGLFDKLNQYSLERPLSSPVHELLVQHFREYLICGGMPAVVKAKAGGAGILEMERIKSSILESFGSDFAKYSKYISNRPDVDLLNQIFEKLPNLIGKKITYSKVSQNETAARVRKHIDFLEQALIIRRCKHTSAGAPPLRAGVNEKIFKLILLDVGLLQTQLGVSIADIKSVADVNKLAKGELAEQFIGQQLLYLSADFIKPQLFHWSRTARGSEAEVDYLIELGGKIYPIEVKAGTSNTMRSLALLQAEKQFPLAVRFYSGEVKKERRTIQRGDTNFSYTLISLPHYACEHIARLLRECDTAEISQTASTGISK